MQVTRETAEGKQLLESLARWQQMAAEVVRVRLLMAVTADPSTIALKSGLRRWVAAGRERAAEATRLRVLRGRTRRARRSATSVGWKRWCTQLSCVTEARDKRTREDAAAKTHDAAHSTLKAWRVWRSRYVKDSALLAAAESSPWMLRAWRRGLRRWRAWMRRRSAWKRQLERRAAAVDGGVAKLHVPCMRRLDTKAVFSEEGSLGVANAWKRRRSQAVVLCRWWAAVLE